jgi:hypothetical protein
MLLDAAMIDERCALSLPDEFEKSSLYHSLKQRVNLLRIYCNVKKLGLADLLADAKRPLYPNEVLSTDKTINPPSFFRRKPTDIVQEIRAILLGDFVTYEKLSIINTPKSFSTRTMEAFTSMRPKFTAYAIEQFDLLVPELNDYIEPTPTTPAQ